MSRKPTSKIRVTVHCKQPRAVVCNKEKELLFERGRVSGRLVGKGVLGEAGKGKDWERRD